MEHEKIISTREKTSRKLQWGVLEIQQVTVTKLERQIEQLIAFKNQEHIQEYLDSSLRTEISRKSGEVLILVYDNDAIKFVSVYLLRQETLGKALEDYFAT